MSTIKRFEDILAWQKAREMTRQIYKITAGVKFAKDYSLREQIRRASVPIMSNIAEGFGRRTDKQFLNFLDAAHASAAEVQSHLYVSLDQNYMSEKEFEALYQTAEETSRMIQGFSNYLKQSRKPEVID